MKKRSRLPAILLCKCPRCRQGDLFKVKNPYRLRHLFDMYKHCPACGQETELEVGFWFGTGYVSYGIAIIVSLFNLAWYWLILGITWRNNSIFWYLIVNSIILVLIMPWIIRLSRVFSLGMFVHYDPEVAENISEDDDKRK